MNLHTQPQQQAFKHVADFVAANDKPRTLLIIFYAGHGYSSIKRTGSTALCNEPRYEGSAYSIEWADVERILKITASDVLVIFDCCQASLLCRSAPEGFSNPSRIFQYLAACDSQELTHRAGPSSFTSAIIWALKELSGAKSFPITELVSRVEKHPPFYSPVLFGGRFDSVSENICLTPKRSVPSHEQPVPHKTSDNLTSTQSDVRLEPLSSRDDMEPRLASIQHVISKTNGRDSVTSSANNEHLTLRSSITGPTTHDATEPKADASDQDWESDKDESDGGSICTDGRANDLPQATKRSLALAFAEHVVDNLVTDNLTTLQVTKLILDIIERLVRDFCVLLGANTTGEVMHLNAITFVRHKRKLIAREIAGSFRRSYHSSKDHVSSATRMDILPFGDTDPSEFEDPDLPSSAPLDVWEDGRTEDNLYQAEIQDVLCAKQFLLSRPELSWLIAQIQTLGSLLQTGWTYLDVKSWITSSLEGMGNRCCLILDFPAPTMMQEEYSGEETSIRRLSDMLVYSGEPSTCYVATASHYAHQVWPAVGTQTLDCFDAALSNTEHIASFLLDDVCLSVEFRAMETKISLETTKEANNSRSRTQLLEVRFMTPAFTSRHGG